MKFIRLFPFSEPLQEGAVPIRLAPTDLDEQNKSRSGPCMIEIQSNSAEFRISAIDLVCNARRMEVFGVKRDYLTTEEGMFLDLGGSGEELIEGGISGKSYLIQHNFDEPVTNCQIKVYTLIGHGFFLSILDPGDQ